MNTLKKEQLLELNQEISLINPEMRPEEIRLGDPVFCKIKGNSNSRSVRMWSYCPFGFEFVDSKDFPHSVGESYQFEMTIGKNRIELDGSIVFKKDISQAESMIGIRINYNSQLARSNDEERRSNSRWNCPEHLLPTGTAPNPVRYNDFILFKVVDVSSNGLKIATSLRNKMLFVGQILECTLSVPMIGTLYAGVKINRVGIEVIGGKSQLILGVSFIKRDDIVSSTLSEYLLTFAEDCSVKSLHEAGFNANNFGTSMFDFSYSKSAKDYDEILNLRFEAYQETGKLASSIDKDFMRDEFDSRSRILTVKLKEKIVGSARAMFHETGDTTSHERYLKYPESFPDISKCLEVSRVCVKPDFQGAGLARELAKHLSLLTIKSGRKFIYLSAAGELVQFWLDLGFKDTGVTYIHKQLGNLEHKLLINDVEKSILGREISGKAWLYSYEQLYKYCVEYGLVEPTFMDTIRVQGFRAARKIL